MNKQTKSCMYSGKLHFAKDAKWEKDQIVVSLPSVVMNQDARCFLS